MQPFEFLVPRRPLSHQAKNRSHVQEWRDFVFSRAYEVWKGVPVSSLHLRFTLVHLSEEDPPDINNIIKPVQDALIGLAYSDDSLVTDVQGHRRMTSDLIDVAGLPDLLKEAVFHGVECVYVRIEPSNTLGELL